MYKKFLALEKKYGWNKLEIEGFYFWNFIRFNIYQNLTVQSREDYLDSSLNKQRINFMCFLTTIYRSLRGYFFPLRQKDLLIFNHPRKLLANGRYECLYTHLLSERFDDVSYTFEFMYQWAHMKPASYEKLIYLDYIDVFSGIYHKLCSFRHKKVLSEITRHIKEICKILDDELGVKTNPIKIASYAQRKYIYYVIKSRLFKRILQKTSPKLIIEVVGYETNKMILNEIAHDMKIKVIELQHGVMGRGHIAYNYASKMELKHFPDEVCLYAQYWKDSTYFPIAQDKIHITGFPYFERNRQKYPKQQSSILTIILISTPVDSQKLKLDVLDLDDVLSNMKIPYKIIYKLHPVEFESAKTSYKVLESRKNIVVIADSDKPLYYYFSISDIQIGTMSTALFEGIGFGLTTYILKTPVSITYMKDLCDNGGGYLIDKITDIPEHYYKKCVDTPQINIDYFWASNSENKLINCIENELDKGTVENIDEN